MVDYQTHAVRASAIVTDAYVAGTIIEAQQSHNQLIVEVGFTIGDLTSGEVKIEFARDIKQSLAYDGQTTNFTVGDEIIGRASGATGIIESDTDGGATGTLVLTNVRGTFLDNEIIIDKASKTGGEARANGTASDASTWIQETFTSINGATRTLSLGESKLSGTGTYSVETPILYSRIKISAKGTGTATSSLMVINAITGRV